MILEFTVNRTIGQSGLCRGLLRRCTAWSCLLLIGLLLSLTGRAQASGPAFLIKDINVGGSSLGSSTSFATINGMLFFAANDGSRGQELWKSDGTADGTTLVK